MLLRLRNLGMMSVVCWAEFNLYDRSLQSVSEYYVVLKLLYVSNTGFRSLLFSRIKSTQWSGNQLLGATLIKVIGISAEHYSSTLVMKYNMH